MSDRNLAEPAQPAPPRQEAVREGERVIMGDRNNQYGPPTQDFDRTAAILNAMGYRRPGGTPLVGHDVAILVMAVKLSRVVWSPEKFDHWVDLIGYAGCGWECVVAEMKTENEKRLNDVDLKTAQIGLMLKD